MKYTIPFGTSEPQDFLLKDAGAPLDGTGLTVELVITRRAGSAAVAVTSPPTVDWLDQAAGTVRVTGTEALAIAFYLVRFKLTDGLGKVGFVPNGEKDDVWHVSAVTTSP